MATPTSPNLVGITGVARRLVQDGALDEAKARAALADASQSKVPVANYLLEKRLVTPAAMAAASSIEFGIPVLEASAMYPEQTAVRLVTEELLRKHCVRPLFKRGNRLFVGTAEPTDTRALDEIKFQTNLRIEPILVDSETIRRLIDRWLENADAMEDAFGDDEEGLENLDVGAPDDAEVDNQSTIDASSDDAPVVKFVNKVLVDAIRKGASDIHFEPYEDEYRVRLRIDGILKRAVRMPVKMQSRISARLKVMAQLDIAEKRVPQDGRIKLNLSKTRQIDFRVSTLPT